MRGIWTILGALIFGAFVVPVATCEAQEPLGPLPESIVPPVRIPIFLAGNFGEPRANHFHSGIDIKTNGSVGVPVLSIADGSVSRIKVEPGGYGHAMYVNHPGGFTSVYAHLDSFSPEIEEYVKDEQYRRESFSVDLFPAAGRFSVKKGQEIARSGNSGSSEGPHLHFEIRDTGSENTLNPLLRSFPLPDKTKPVIARVYLFSLSGRSEWIKPIEVPVALAEGVYRSTNPEPAPLDAITGIGIETWDLIEGSANKCGAYRIQGLIDGQLFFDFKADEFAFSETRFMNSFMDYRHYLTNRRPVLKLFIEPNNHLSLYQFSRNKGRIEIRDDQSHQLTIYVDDVAGNRSEVKLLVKLQPARYKRDPDFLPVYDAYFSCKEINRFTNDGFELTLPSGALYDDIYFQYDRISGNSGTYSDIHKVHRADIPLHQYGRLAIAAKNLPERLRSKAVIAQLSGGNRYVSLGGTWEGSRLVTRSRSFGQFSIRVDTVKPEIKPLNFTQAEELRSASAIRFSVRDDFTGIQSYRAEMDGKWILLEYDPKNNLMEYVFDPKRFTSGKEHLLSVFVSDGVQNTTSYTVKFFR